MHDIDKMGTFQICFIFGLMLVSFPLFFLLFSSSNFSTTFEKYADLADIIAKSMFEFESIEEQEQKEKK